jgi:hypothetical protein
VGKPLGRQAKPRRRAKDPSNEPWPLPPLLSLYLRDGARRGDSLIRVGGRNLRERRIGKGSRRVGKRGHDLDRIGRRS